MNRTQIGDIKDLEGKEVELAGWVHARRDHGKIIFIDLRDHTGLVQVVFAPSSPPPTSPSKEGEGASGLRLEYVVKVNGKVKKRPPAMVNDKIPNGNYEVEATALTIVNRAEALPIPVDDDGYETNEEMRMKYRYLDLRRERLQRNLRLRHKVTMLAREFLSSQGFIEVETPLLTKSSPEGARDFLVPSRLQPGKFYALPQAPQQYKQLLMIAGVDRYFQIARALRDEDLRGERQLEHTQIDMEMSWAGEEGVRAITEAMMIRIAEACGKKIWKKPFPVFTHEEAMKKFGADKFDLRDSDASVGASSNASVGASSSASVGAGPADPDTLAFAWVVDFPLLERDEDPSTGSGQGRWTFAHNPFSAPKAEHVERLMSAEDEQDENLGNIRAQQYDLVCNGHELASGGVRISDPMVQRKVFEIMGLTPEQVESRFGHLIRAYEYGAPPHAGIAPGLDRLVMLLANERNIREVIAFPVSSSGQTSVMDAPSAVDEKQLRELGIRIAPPDAHA